MALNINGIGIPIRITATGDIGTDSAETIVWALSAQGTDITVHNAGGASAAVFELAADDSIAFPKGMHLPLGCHIVLAGAGAVGVVYSQ